jgi:hypothetical protein
MDAHVGDSPNFRDLHEEAELFLKEINILPGKVDDIKGLLEKVTSENLKPHQQRQLSELKEKFHVLDSESKSQKWQTIPTRRLVQEVFKASITGGRLGKSLKSVAAIAKHAIASQVHGGIKTELGRLHKVKQTRQMCSLSDNFLERCYAQDVHFASKLKIKSHNLPRDEDVETRQDYEKALELACQLREMIDRDSLKKWGLSSLTIDENAKPGSGISEGICFGIEAHFLQKVHEAGIKTIDADALIAILKREQGEESGGINKGWSAEAAANQAVAKLIWRRAALNTYVYSPGGIYQVSSLNAAVLFNLAFESLQPKGVASEGARPPFDCDLQTVKDVAIQYLRETKEISVEDFIKQLKADNEFPEGLKNKENSVVEILKSVQQLKKGFELEMQDEPSSQDVGFAKRFEAQMQQLFGRKKQVTPIFLQSVENPVLRKLYSSCERRAVVRIGERIIAQARGYNMSPCASLSNSFLLGNDEDYLRGIKEKLHPGTYMLEFTTSDGAHATSLVVTAENQFFFHDPNVGLLECDANFPENTILDVLQHYEEPQGADDYKAKGKMFHRVEILQFTP